MKYISEIVLVLILSLGIFFVMPKNISVAGAISSKVTSVKPEDGASVMGKETSKVKEITSKILGFLQMATGLISILVIGYTGFHYITAGTPDVKMELKNKMLPIVIGAALVFGAVSIARFIVSAIES